MPAVFSANKMWTIKQYSERYTQSAKARQPLVLLSGWSCDSHIFDWLIPGLAQHFVIVSAELNHIPSHITFEQCCAELSDILFPEFTQPINFLAWSLGGNIAMALANQSPELCKNITVLGTTPVFVNNDSVDWAMPIETFQVFQQQVSANRANGLKQFDRLMTAAGDKSNLKSLRSAVKDYRAEQVDARAWDAVSLNKGLEFLQQLDQREIITHLKTQGVTLHALLFAGDALVNVKAEQAYSKVTIIEGASHLGFLTHTEIVYQTCLDMRCDSVESASEDKHSIATAFSNAATHYDEASDVQQRIAAHVFSRLSASVKADKQKPTYIVDAGCGTGLWTDKLTTLAEQVTGVDFADGMLRLAKSRYPNVRHWLQADLETMPMIAGQSDYIFSSLAVQWCDDFQSMLAHWYTLLKPGGEVVLATLATDTLCELAECFSHIDARSHVNDFYSYQQLLNFVECSDFLLEFSEQKKEVQYYPSAIALMHDLKSIGAQTVKTKEGLVKPKPMTKSQLLKVSASYEKYRCLDNLLPATYDVVYLHLKKPVYTN